METLTYSQVQELVEQLPETKLSLAYSLLLELADTEADTPSPQLDFMRLPFFWLALSLLARWFWSATHPKVRKIGRLMKRKYQGSALGEIYGLMCSELNNIRDVTSFTLTYEKAKSFSREIESIFAKKGVSFTSVNRV